jgi:hypothetical protein
LTEPNIGRFIIINKDLLRLGGHGGLLEKEVFQLEGDLGEVTAAIPPA